MSQSKHKIRIINAKGAPFTSLCRAERFVAEGQAVWGIQGVSIQFVASLVTLEKDRGYDNTVHRGLLATRQQRKRLPVAGDPDVLLRHGGKSWYRHGWDASVYRH